MVNNTHSSADVTVFKTIRAIHHVDAKLISMVQRDAVVMERLSDAPDIVAMYGHCGTSVSVQRVQSEVEERIVPNGYIKQSELNDKDDVQPQNPFTPTEKVHIAYQMAQSLARLHGFSGGVIVHDDVQLCQWLETTDNSLVLGDFNRAEIMDYNVTGQHYCRYVNGEQYVSPVPISTNACLFKVLFPWVLSS